jgi:histidinol-phosphatase
LNSACRSRYDLAITAAQEAGRHALTYFDKGVNVEWKSNQTPVTVADREAEQLLRETLLAKFPEDGFLGEEFGEQPGTSGFRWIIDPIDGTRSFVRGVPLWATLVGLEYEGEQIAGVAYIPTFKQVFRALRGDGAFRDERRIRVSEITAFEDAQAFYSSISWFMKGGCKDAFIDLVSRTQRQRGFGDFYGFLMVAQGSGEMMVEYGVSPWDVAALKPIVEEAGGRCTDWDGNSTILRPDILATNGRMHEAALALLKNGRGPDFQPGVWQNVKHIA